MTKLSKNGLKRMKVKRNRTKTQTQYVVWLCSSKSTALRVLQADPCITPYWDKL